MYRRFSIQTLLRILLILVSMYLLVRFWNDDRLFFTPIIIALLLLLQIAELIYFVNHTNRALSRLFLAIRNSDFTISFKENSLGNSFQELHRNLYEIMQAYKQVKIEEEAQYQFLQTLMGQLNVGIIVLQENRVTLLNAAAESLLNIQSNKDWEAIRRSNPQLVSEIESVGDSGRKLVEFNQLGQSKILSIDISSSIILGTNHKLIILQDINSEIEQKEIEAWQKLIRILTHEIMNSITPVTSLTETMQSMLTDKDNNPKDPSLITRDTIQDLRFSIATIQKRNEGLLTFVENYRSLSKVAQPVIVDVNIRALIKSIEALLSDQLTRHKIELTVDIEDPTLVLRIDQHLIEQVLINIITNSIHALEGRSERAIVLKTYGKDNRNVIEITDTGKGMEPKEMAEIFVPFFTTKKEGSGIGLSLSKQIMSMHGGTIKVASAPGEGSSFYLYFRRN